MDSFWKYKLDHIIFWVTTVGFHMFTRLYLINKAGPVHFLMEVLVRNVLLAGMIYVNLRFLIPRLAQQKKLAAYVICLLISLGIYVLGKNAHDVYLNGYVLGDLTKRHLLYNTYYNLSIAIFYLAFSVALYLSKEWYEQRELLRKIEIEKLNTELEYLKAQINPHFIFNSINTIYFQIDKQNATARESLSAFSEMLRYQLYECNGKEIPIEKEINYLKNYVDLQRMRKDENYEISFEQEENVKGFTISPLLLIPFVENAFKHVSHYPEKNIIRICLSRNKDYFLFHVLNTTERKSVNGEHNGIGLKNVKRRLQLLYDGKHSLNVNHAPDCFEVNLNLKIS